MNTSCTTARVTRAIRQLRTLHLWLDTGDTARVPFRELIGLPWIHPGCIIVYTKDTDTIHITRVVNPHRPWWLPFVRLLDRGAKPRPTLDQ